MRNSIISTLAGLTLVALSMPSLRAEDAPLELQDNPPERYIVARGDTLWEEYRAKGDGVLQKVNLMIATGQNNLAMNRTVKQIAQYHITGGKVTEGALNRIEHGIRLYDPCLSCSTHAVGQMPMVVDVVDARGEVVDRVMRE